MLHPLALLCPCLTLGILGSGTTAIMLGALIAYGIQPGPLLYLDHPDIFWSVIISMYFGNLVLLILNLSLIPYISRLLAIPPQILNPSIIFFSIISVYLVSFNTFDIQMMVFITLMALGIENARLYNGSHAAWLYFGWYVGKELE